MSIKIGMGRGKKGDGLHVNRETKQRSYGQARNIAMMSNDKVEDIFANRNTRAKDAAKAAAELMRRGIYI